MPRDGRRHQLPYVRSLSPYHACSGPIGNFKQVYEPLYVYADIQVSKFRPWSFLLYLQRASVLVTCAVTLVLSCISLNVSLVNVVPLKVLGSGTGISTRSVKITHNSLFLCALRSQELYEGNNNNQPCSSSIIDRSQGTATLFLAALSAWKTSRRGSPPHQSVRDIRDIRSRAARLTQITRRELAAVVYPRRSVVCLCESRRPILGLVNILQKSIAGQSARCAVFDLLPDPICRARCPDLPSLVDAWDTKV